MSDPLLRLRAALTRAADAGSAQMRHVLYRALDKTTRRCLGGDFLHELHERARAADARVGGSPYEAPNDHHEEAET
jgi:hypothetical protein